MGRRITKHRIYKKADPMDLRRMELWINHLTRLGVKYEIREIYDADHEPAHKVVWDRDRYMIAFDKKIRRYGI